MMMEYIPLLLQGMSTTLMLWCASMLISCALGMTLGFLACNQLSTFFAYRVIKVYVFIIRGIPLYVHLLIMYFVLPALCGINISAEFAGILALGICSSAYMTEIIRSGINAIPIGQWEACFTLGYTRLQTIWHVIFPQLLRFNLPAITNELDAAIKSTSLFSTIGVLEITKVGTNIVARTMNPIPVFCGIACIYILLSLGLLLGVRALERNMYCDNN